MTRSVWGRIAGAAAAVLVAFTLAPTASAAPSKPTADGDTHVLTADDLDAMVKAKAGSGAQAVGNICDPNHNGLIDYYVGARFGQLWCVPNKFEVYAFQWVSDGRWEIFGVGSDYAIYHIWQRYKGDPDWSDWQSLGGIATSGVYQGSPVNGYPRVFVWGTDFPGYCSHFVPDPVHWTPWYHC